jgi:ATP-dependent DNA helicase RecQ
MTTYDTRLMHQGARAVRRHAINTLLRKVFAKDRLRDGQQQVIDSVLDGKDTLAIMPTGSGKSLCYQLPARLLKGTAIVVSPLISLMQDQLDKLEALGIRAAQLNSSLAAAEEEAALGALAAGELEIVFCTPERLAQPDFLAVLKRIAIDLFVVDEAHCISQWGHDFRPAYIDMAAALAALGRPTVLALTATATEDVVDDIRKQLGRPRMQVINTGIYRPNLHYAVAQVTNLEEKTAAALRLVADAQGAGIVYAATVKAAEELHLALQEAGESVALYHGKLPAAERKLAQEQFMSGERRVMVATNAFGMGIDKADVRFVIHLQLPANLESYYQESGRAGRDGQDADCTLLFLQDDKRIQQFFLVKHYPDAAELKDVHGAVLDAARDGPVPFSRLDQQVDELATSKLKVCLKLLKDGRLLRQDRKLAYLPTGADASHALFEELAAGYSQKQERDREALELMVSYAVSAACRWKLLLDYFGDQVEGFERCCRCDNCRNPPVVAEPIADDEFAPAPPAAPAPPFEVGARVKVPRYGAGTVLAVAGEEITIGFGEDQEPRTFIADFVEPA